MKEVAKIEVIKPGSNPDVDTDFSTVIQGKIMDYVSETYGKDNVASIITMGSLAAKGAFKQMCTIYNVPFASANKITQSIPPTVEGVDCTLDDIYNPESDRYAEGEEFRALTAGKEWTSIIEGALAIEGRYRNSGVHPCGVIISNKPLGDVVPLQIRKTDGRVITQWTYPDCESIGLIKFDFLGLDTVDLIQHTVEYIMKNGKEPPNMTELIHGDMDDKETYDMISRGETLGIFQLGSGLVRDFLKVMKPDTFNDIAATTAIMRPGPMGMGSHTKYANRKNGIEKPAPIHKEFKGSELEEILADTQQIVIYQEQVMKISNRIAGMTLQEGDDLRKAMGKKKIAKMMEMKPKFIEGGQKNGFSEEAMNALWDVLEPFSKYGFNKSHSVAYAMAAYQSSWLKCHYPIEFMSALISQNVGDKKKILVFLQEARRMGLSIGGVDINRSDINVAPDYENETEYDILYGLSGINGVSQEAARIIVEERNNNGDYTSVHDFINRTIEAGLNNSKIHENLAKAGAFDQFGVKRKTIVENIKSLMASGKRQVSLGMSLFDHVVDPYADESFTEMEDYGEYPYVDKLKEEANVVGLYLTGHPLDKAGTGLSHGGIEKISEIIKGTRRAEYNIVGSITEIDQKIRRTGKTISITADDGSAYIEAKLSRNLVKGINKKISRAQIKKAYISGADSFDKKLIEHATFDGKEIDELEQNSLYLMKVKYFPGYGEDSKYHATIEDITPLELDDEGRLPIRIRVKKGKSEEAELEERLKVFSSKVAKRYPGKYPIYASVFSARDAKGYNIKKEYYERLNRIMSKKKDRGETLPKPRKEEVEFYDINETDISYNIRYFNTGYSCDKTVSVEQLLTQQFGSERVDYGLYNELFKEDSE